MLADWPDMVSSIATSPAIDLSRLPPPVLIDQPDFETRRQAKIARLIELVADFTALVESDPAIKLIEADSYDEMVLVQAFVDGMRQNLIAFATGSNLEHLGALYGVTRLELAPADPEHNIAATMESDAALRERIVLAPHSFSVAGPELAYVYFARSASSDVLDASATSPTPGHVIVSVLSRTGNGAAPDETIEAVDDYLQGPVRPMTDLVTVQSAEIVDFSVEAELYLYSGPDPALILQTAQASLAAFLASAKRLGRDIPRSALIAALHVAGVQRVDLASPVADVVLTKLQAGNATDSDISIAGTAE